MKKALALVLALVLALSLGVSAFAVTVVELKPASSSSADKIEVTELIAEVDDNVYYLLAGEGGTYYVRLADLEGDKEYKNVTVTATGAVAAEVVEYDPAKYEEIEEVEYYIYDTLAKEIVEPSDVASVLHAARVQDKNAVVIYDGSNYQAWYVGYYVESNNDFWYTGTEALKGADGKAIKYDKDGQETGYNYSTANNALPNEAKKVKAGDTVKVNNFRDVTTSYSDMKAIAGILNDAARSDKYVVKTDNETTLIKVTVDDNYSAAYKTGNVKVSAVIVDGRKKTNVSQTLNIIRDVSIFEYNLVKWAGANNEALVVGAVDGYSDYLTAAKGYGATYDEAELREYPATVVSTTAFRALREAKDGISVEAGEMLVEIEEIGSSQKGVNFAYDQGNGSNRENFNGIIKVYDAEYYKKGIKIAESIDFGFLGDQTIASDFTVVVDLGMNAYELREFFGEKVEEEDIITYYVVKNGKVADSFTVDYMKDDIDKDLELEIKGKAGETLGEYSIVLEAPTAASEGEENPNTGAESVIGVVAAMAVVSLAAAAAVSLKK